MEINRELEEISVGAARAVGSEISGVDVVVTPEGEYTILEVNTCPTFPEDPGDPGDPTGKAVSKALAGYLARRLKEVIN